MKDHISITKETAESLLDVRMTNQDVGIFIKLALAADDNGIVNPWYVLRQTSMSSLGIDRTLKKFEKLDLIEPNGQMYEIKNWNSFQL